MLYDQVVSLPSLRKEHTNYIKAAPGYQQEVIDMRHESKCDELSENRRYVAILLDEMKHSGDIIGFCNLVTT